MVAKKLQAGPEVQLGLKLTDLDRALRGPAGYRTLFEVEQVSMIDRPALLITLGEVSCLLSAVSTPAEYAF